MISVPTPIYTIGHSTHPIEAFIALLKQHGITAVADVRSAPYSRFNPQFSKEPLGQALRAAGIAYVFLGRELGARTEDRSCYENGRVRYDRLAKTDLFRSGLDRVRKGAGSHRVALMCAEKDPLHCHRTILVARALEREGVAVTHILADGGLEPHEVAIRRLMSELRLQPPDMFRTADDLAAEAYAKQEERIAYQEETEAQSAADGGRR
jgi:uncharacterized protein (DUF488 family)